VVPLQDIYAALTALPFLVWLTLLAYSMRLIFGEEEEKTKGLTIFGTIMIAGAAMVLAKPIAFWLMGVTYDEDLGIWYKDKDGNGMYDPGEELDVPQDLTNMMNRFFSLLMVIGAFVVIIGFIIAAIRYRPL
jgi:hypothetical protein